MNRRHRRASMGLALESADCQQVERAHILMREVWSLEADISFCATCSSIATTSTALATISPPIVSLQDVASFAEAEVCFHKLDTRSGKKGKLSLSIVSIILHRVSIKSMI